MVTSSLSLFNNEDWSVYFPSAHRSLVMTMVMLIKSPPMTAGKAEDTPIKLDVCRSLKPCKKQLVSLHEPRRLWAMH